MANEQNLKPFEKGCRSTEEAARLGQKGGKASGEARRRKGDARRYLKAILAMKPQVTDQLRKNLEKMGADMDKEEFSTERLIMIALTQKAMKGDTKAIQLYLEMMEEDPKLIVEQDRLKMEMKNSEHVPGFASLDEAVDAMMVGDAE